MFLKNRRNITADSPRVFCCFKRAISFMSLALAFNAAHAVDPNLFEVWNYNRGNDATIEVPGRLFVPPAAINNPNQRYPLVIFYHGQAERGTDNTKQVESNINYLFANANSSDPQKQFFLYAPQLPDSSGSWGQSFVDDTMRAVSGVMAHYNIDPERVYITGISLGGGAVRYAIGHYADIYAAAAPICGVAGGNQNEIPNAVGKHIWQLHAEYDGTVSSSNSRDHVNAIWAAGGYPQQQFPLTNNYGAPVYANWENKTFIEQNNLRYTEDKSANHFVWDAFYNDSRFYQWLLEKSVDPRPEVDDILCFDFGTSVLSGTDSQGRRWNSTSSSHHATLNGVIQFARKSTGPRTSVGVTVVQPFGSATTSGLSSSLFNNTISQDGWLTSENATESSGAGVVRFSGLTPEATYRIEIFASHSNNDSGNGRVSQYKIGTQTVDLDAVNNTSNLAVFSEVTANSAGHIDLKVYPKPGTTSRYGQINALTIKRLSGGGTPPVNQAPYDVNAGTDQTITLPATASLAGSAQDDGLPNGTLTYAWSKVSGPGNVNFSNPNAAQTTASFSQDGVYVLKLTVSDGELDDEDTVQITVNPEPSGGGSGGLVLFEQNFNSSSSVTAYVATGSAGPNLLNDISPQSGTNAWSIDGGKLKVTHTSTSVSPGFARYTDLPGDPKFALLEFDFSMSGFSTWSAAGMIYLGQMTSTPNYTGNWFFPSTVSAKLEIKGYGTSGYNIVVSGSQTGQIANPAQEKTISIYINKTGSTQTYTGPDNVSGRTLSDNSISIFVAGEIRINNVAILSSEATSTNLTDFFMYFRQDGTYAVDNIKVVDLLAGPPANQAPVANADSITTPEGQSYLADVLANDTDSDGPSSLTLQSVAQPAHGTTAIESNKVRYTPHAGYYGSDSFTYVVTDGAAIATGTVSVTVQNTALALDLTGADLDGVNIGTNSAGSSRILAGGTDWEVNGSGTGLANTADSFHFEECGVSGDFVMVARMKSLASAASSTARAGIMLRDHETNAGARMVALATTTGSNYKTIKRLATSGTAVEDTPSETYTYPDAWVMLERVGDIVTAAVSEDGDVFAEVDSVLISGSPAELFGGVFSSSGSVGVNARAVLSDFDIYDSDALLKLNFNGSTTLSDYFTSSPNINQIDQLQTASGSTWSISNGRLQLVHGGSGAHPGFTRHTNMGGSTAPQFVAVEFDFSYSTSVQYNPAANFAFAQLSGAGPYGGTLGYGSMAARLSVRCGDQAGKFKLEFNDNARTGNLDAAQLHRVYWVINTSGAQQTYVGPDGDSYSVNHARMDLWVNGSRVLAGIERTGGYGYNLLQDFYFSFDQQGTYQIDNFTIRNLLP
jgi:predicted esterase